MVTLVIEDFDMEPGKDYVLIRNEPEADAENLPSFLQSTIEPMYLYIHADLSDSRKELRYSLGCDLTLGAANGTLVSPGYDMADDFRYPNNLECDYRLRALGGSPISLRFVDF